MLVQENTLKDLARRLTPAVIRLKGAMSAWRSESSVCRLQLYTLGKVAVLVGDLIQSVSNPLQRTEEHGCAEEHE